ncbi:MAG: glycosyltransferase family 4 protein [Provencibacterium sp.]|jgi:1,2-diacylglycerol 3-alpha-glucosyltransferase|nr:glycosyltransferase family 4 protein [Provencibacterium sp.]
MRIALFTETYLPHINGVVTHVKSLKDGLEAMGHTVLVVTANSKTRKHYIKENVLYCPAHKISKRLYGFDLAPAVSRTRLRFLRDFNPDIIHIHNEFGIGLSGIGIAKILRVPLVYTLHTMYDEYIYYVAPAPLVGITTRISHRYFRIFAKSADEVTGPSLKCEMYLKETGLDKPVSVVPNPVELDAFSPEKITEEDKRAFREKFQIAPDEMIAIFVGRLGREKSVDVLLRNWAAEMKPGDRIRLVVIGDGPEKENLEALAAGLGIADTVVFTGRVEHSDLPPYIASGDVYVTASLSDTNSISMLEGMAAGLPVLQLYDELNKDQVRDGINGFIFRDAAEMAAKLRRLKGMDEEQLRILKASVRQSVKNSGAQNLANYINTIYTRILSDEKPENAKKRPLARLLKVKKEQE